MGFLPRKDKMEKETLAIYSIPYNKKFDVVGYMDADTPEGEHEFFDIFDTYTGECINEGNPFFEMPTREDVMICYKDYCDRGITA